MATSGSSNFSLNTTQIIHAALAKIGVMGEGQSLSPQKFNQCKLNLNAMIKSWSTIDLHLWCKEEAVLYLEQYVGKYSLGNAVSDSKATLISDEIMTQLNGAVAAAATSITVDDTTGMTVGDYIGIVLTDRSTHWSTIDTIPSATTLTILSGLASAASDNAYIYTFTNKIYKPMRVTSVRVASGIDLGSTSTKSTVSIGLIPYQSYFDMPTLANNGDQPNLVHYNPRISQGDLFVSPRPSDTSKRIEFSFQRIIENLDTLTDDFDFPGEWTETLIYQGAIRFAPDFGRAKKIPELTPQAAELLDNLKAWDRETSSIFIQPDYGD